MASNSTERTKLGRPGTADLGKVVIESANVDISVRLIRRYGETRRLLLEQVSRPGLIGSRDSKERFEIIEEDLPAIIEAMQELASYLQPGWPDRSLLTNANPSSPSKERAR